MRESDGFVTYRDLLLQLLRYFPVPEDGESCWWVEESGGEEGGGEDVVQTPGAADQGGTGRGRGDGRASWEGLVEEILEAEHAAAGPRTLSRGV